MHDNGIHSQRISDFPSSATIRRGEPARQPFGGTDTPRQSAGDRDQPNESPLSVGPRGDLNALNNLAIPDNAAFYSELSLVNTAVTCRRGS
jgi:hypothetical protein